MDPTSSRHHTGPLPHPSYNQPLCSSQGHGPSPNNLGLQNGPFFGGPGALSAPLPHQLSQLCNSQHPLLALQNLQDFSHLLPPNFTIPQQFSHLQSQLPNETLFSSLQNSTNNHYHNLQYQNHHQTSHHQRNHNNWRKSKTQSNPKLVGTAPDGAPFSLLNLSAKVVAEHIPFQTIEQRYEHIPEPVQRQIIFWSFPRHEDDIKMYSSLSSESVNLGTSALSSTTASNSTSQPPSSNTAFMWVEQSTIHNNPSQNHQISTHLKNSNKFTFHKGLRLYDEGCVQDALQVGFNLSGIVNIRDNPVVQVANNPRMRNNNHGHANIVNNHDATINQNHLSIASNESPATKDTPITKSYRVSVTFDRCKITSVSCSCELQDIFWCEHVVALIIYRIRNPETIDLRVPISETLSSLDRQQLQKLVQYIIAEHHTQVLPTAQRLLDEMRHSYSEINQMDGAPDPTAGACSDDEHIWHLDEDQVNEKVQAYLHLACSNSKDAFRQINALFEKIREMFRAKDSNGTRMLRLITEQFLLFATRNDKSRSLWDQLVSLWVVVMLNPDLSHQECLKFNQLLSNWSRVSKCPKEDIERRVTVKRRVAELSDDEDSDDTSFNGYFDAPPNFLNRSNTYPAHMATHRRNYQPDAVSPVLRQYNQAFMPTSTCPFPTSRSASKKIKLVGQNPEQVGSSSRPSRSSGPSSGHHSLPRVVNQNINENRVAPVQEPRSVFHRALDFLDLTWDDPHLQMILNKDGPVDFNSSKTMYVDYASYPLWTEPISQSAARIETLRSYGYIEQALRLTVATVRRLKLHQQQWLSAKKNRKEVPLSLLDFDDDDESWIGHPFDPINVMLDLLLNASLTEPDSSRIACPYDVMVDFNKILPNLASLPYPQNGFHLHPMVNPPSRRAISSTSQSSANKTPFFHVPVPGCYQEDSYLSLGVELALIALGQQRPIPTMATAHERAVGQESDLISKLESIDISDPLLIKILERQIGLILDGGPFQNLLLGSSSDSAPMHTFARYLFDSLVPHSPDLAYKIGVLALKMPLAADENIENYGAARASPRSINYNHLQNEQLVLAQTMLTRAKEEKECDKIMGRVYRASVKNIRNPNNLHKLSKHVLKEAKTSLTSLHPNYKKILETAFDLGVQVLKMTLTPHSSNSKTRREAILFIVDCATDMGIEAVSKVMKEACDNFSSTEALNLVVSRDSDSFNNLRSQAIAKLKLKDNPTVEYRLNYESRELALKCALRDPTNCALEAIKFCQENEKSLNQALTIVIEAGKGGAMDSTQLIKVAEHIDQMKDQMKDQTDRAFEIALVAVDTLNIPPNSDNSAMKKDIFAACDYAKKVESGFSKLIPKLLRNIQCASVLSDIYHQYYPKNLTPSANGPFDVAIPQTSFRGNSIHQKGYNPNALNTDIYTPGMYMQKLEDAYWWDQLLKETMQVFEGTTRSRLSNISPRHYGEFIDFLCKARRIFEKAPDGPHKFRNLLSEIVKTYKTKKKLMEKLKFEFKEYLNSKV